MNDVKSYKLYSLANGVHGYDIIGTDGSRTCMKNDNQGDGVDLYGTSGDPIVTDPNCPGLTGVYIGEFFPAK